MPERIAKVAKRMIHLHIFALFQCALAVRRAVKRTIFKYNAVAAVKRAFFIKLLILKCFQT